MILRLISQWLLLVVIFLGISPLGLALEKNSSYQVHTIRGWTIHYDAQLVKDDISQLLNTFVLLDDKLDQISAILPKPTLTYLQQVPIWISSNHGEGLVYHASGTWLLTHGRDPAMAGSIELQHLEDFAVWSESQPMVLLHEMAHALHHRVFNYQHKIINAAFRNAKILGLYQSVKRYDGSYAKSYALENEREYFAELTEAYFGQNDYYPFNRKQLKEYDPIGHAMIETVWYSDFESEDKPTIQAKPDLNHAPAATHAP